MKNLNFVTTSNTASLYAGKTPLVLNLTKQELFKLFAATEDAIDRVEEVERNQASSNQASHPEPESAPRGGAQIDADIPAFGECLSE